MAGMDPVTGKKIDGLEQLRAEIRDVLETPVGSRVMRRDYGSRLFELVDEPVDQRFQVEAIQASAEALRQWVPRLELRSIEMQEVTDSGPVFIIRGHHRDIGPVTLEGV